MVPVSGARVLAHELAHPVLGCEGKLLSGVKAPLDKVDELYKEPNRAEQTALRNEFEAARATGTFGERKYDVPLKNFGDLGEYDAIVDWKNEIAAELVDEWALHPTSGMRGTYPRFSH